MEPGINKFNSILIRIIAFMLASGLFVLSRYAFIFFIFGIMPSISAFLIDKRINRCASNTISAFNLTGMLPYLFTIIQSDSIDATAQTMISDIYIWFVIYGAAACGWLTLWIVPEIFGRIMLARAKAKMEEFEQKKAEIVAEWGEDVSGQVGFSNAYEEQ